VSSEADVDRRPALVPGRYWIWLSGVLLSLLGTQVMAFGMTWIAAAQGGSVAGLLLTAINLPRVLLLLVGGALADRIGAWRVMITADATMTAATLLLGGALVVLGPRTPVLLAAALAIGIVDAFYLPSSGSMPRRLAPGPVLPRAMSARQVVGQFAAFAGPSAGGLVVATAGLAAAAFANAGTFAVMAFVLVALRPRTTHGAARTTHGAGRPAAEPQAADRQVTEPRAAGEGDAVPGDDHGDRPAPPPRGMLRRAGDGLRVAWTDPVLRPALGLTAAAAGFLLPVYGLLIALLAREQQWSARTGGTLTGAVALGMVGVATTVTIRGGRHRPGLAATGGLVIAAAGTAGLAAAPTTAAAVAAALVTGLGSGVLSTHIGPLILGGTPASHLSRLQSVLVLVQSLPLLLTNNVLGALADAATTRSVLYLCAAILLVSAAAAMRSSALRTTTSDRSTP
jgi:MFS family permease